MATNFTLEGYNPVGELTLVTDQPQKCSLVQVSWWQLFEKGAKYRYGSDIEVLRTESSENDLTRFVEDLEFTVIQSDAEPLITRPTIIDVTTKEVVNLGQTEKDETTIRVGKNSTLSYGTRYHFKTSEGVRFDRKYNFGARVVGLAMIGGFMRVGEDRSTTDRSYNMALQFDYRQEEKLIVPPRTKVKLKITTLSKKFRQDYTLEFDTPRSRYVNVSYLTKCQQNCRDNWCCFGCGCCCCQPKRGVVFAADILRTLPNFKDGGGICSFTQKGTLTWIGESSNTEKTEIAVP